MVVISVEDDHFAKIHYYIGVDDVFEEIDLPLSKVASYSLKVPKYTPVLEPSESHLGGEQLTWVKSNGKR